MQAHSKIQKWGNSSAVRLPAKLLAAAGIDPESDVDIQAGDGRLVIQLPERSQEQLFDKLLAEVPDAKEVLATVQAGLTRAIATTDKSVLSVERLCRELNKKTG
ncbi:MAG: AbrB/MazE/SpoVT family DNA-binding domain-containing protein [Gammaproteobacteria bacterium]|nr:AbrB/MazE/SpoVT family DNA-binding domain-containing protein [Gammaproteobacteria bacterium]